MYYGYYPDPYEMEKIAYVNDVVYRFVKVAEEEGIDLSGFPEEEIVDMAMEWDDAVSEEEEDLEEKMAAAYLLGQIAGEAQADAYMQKMALYEQLLEEEEFAKTAGYYPYYFGPYGYY